MLVRLNALNTHFPWKIIMTGDQEGGRAYSCIALYHGSLIKNKVPEQKMSILNNFQMQLTSLELIYLKTIFLLLHVIKQPRSRKKSEKSAINIKIGKVIQCISWKSSDCFHLEENETVGRENKLIFSKNWKCTHCLLSILLSCVTQIARFWRKSDPIHEGWLLHFNCWSDYQLVSLVRSIQKCHLYI